MSILSTDLGALMKLLIRGRASDRNDIFTAAVLGFLGGLLSA
jgi:hypothetical protein